MTSFSPLAKVVVVAAGPVMRDSLVASLTARGFTVAGYASLQAMNKPATAIGCVVVDLAKMGPQSEDADPYAIKEALCRCGLEAPTILLSGRLTAAAGGLCLQRKLTILVKPVDPAFLAQLVERAISASVR